MHDNKKNYECYKKSLDFKKALKQEKIEVKEKKFEGSQCYFGPKYHVRRGTRYLEELLYEDQNKIPYFIVIVSFLVL